MKLKACLILSVEFWEDASDMLVSFSASPQILNGYVVDDLRPGFLAFVPLLVSGDAYAGTIHIPLHHILMIATDIPDTAGFHMTASQRKDRT